MSSHKWDIRWDDKEDSCVDVCLHCGIKKRERILYHIGTVKRCGKVKEYLIDGVWNPVDTRGCIPKSQRPKK